MLVDRSVAAARNNEK